MGRRSAPIPSKRASTLEGQIARVADIIAYVNHDIDDAIRAGLLRESDLPAAAVGTLGRSSSERIGRMVTDVVHETLRVERTRDPDVARDSRRHAGAA